MDAAFKEKKKQKYLNNYKPAVFTETFDMDFDASSFILVSSSFLFGLHTVRVTIPSARLSNAAAYLNLMISVKKN